jgi:hypothetical protein
VLVFGGGLSITGANILLLYPPLSTVWCCFKLVSLFACFFDFVCVFTFMFCAPAPPLIGVAPMNIHEVL